MSLAGIMPDNMDIISLMTYNMDLIGFMPDNTTGRKTHR
jgi:hypothetical protein